MCRCDAQQAGTSALCLRGTQTLVWLWQWPEKLWVRSSLRQTHRGCAVSLPVLRPTS